MEGKTLTVLVEGEEDPLNLPVPVSYAELLEVIAAQYSVDQAQVLLERRLAIGSTYVLSDISYTLSITHLEPTLHAVLLPKTAFLEGGYYAGDMEAEVPHGYGNMYYRNLDCYRGEWVQGRYQGPGALSRKSPSTLLEGEFYEGLPDGHLVEMSPQATYSGSFKSGVKAGKGKTVFSDSAVFEGSYAGDVLVGRGTMTLADGTRYEGDLDDHVATGTGVIAYTDGSIYEGEVRKGLRHGLGKLKHKAGWVLEGRFEANAASGEGVLTTVEGKQTMGRWANDELVEVEKGLGPIHYRLSLVQ